MINQRTVYSTKMPQYSLLLKNFDIYYKNNFSINKINATNNN